MALKIFEKFDPRANPIDGNYPTGSLKNESVPGANDGTPLDADWGNDSQGFTDALLNEAGIVHSGNPDNKNTSDRLSAINKISISNDLTFASVASLKTVTNLKGVVADPVKLADTNAMVRTVDYYGGWAALARRPQGGATYTIMTAVDYATLTSKNGDVTLNSGQVAVLNVLNNTANVLQYGAKADGSFDDTTAVNNAHADYDSVFFPKTDDSYQITNVTLNDRAKFTSNSATVIATTTGSCFIITDAVGASAENIEISGFLLESGTPSSGVGINVGTNIRRVYIRNNRIKLFNKGIQIEGAYSSDISFNEIRNNTIGIEMNDGNHAVTLMNNLLNQNTTRGLSITGTMRNVTIVGGAYQASQIGIFADGVESLTILGDVYYEINSIADVKLVNCYTPKILSGNSSSPVSEASVVLEDCAGNCRVAGMTFAAGTSTTPAHILISGVNGVTVIEDVTPAAGHANPIDTTGATNAKNVSVGSGCVYSLNATNKGINYKVTQDGVVEWSEEFTNAGTPAGRSTLEILSTTGRDMRINTGGVFRLHSNNQAEEYYSVNLGTGNTNFEQKGHFRPFTAYDGVYSIGAATNRWNTVYAVTGAINTSDERAKQDIRSMDDKECAIAVKLKSAMKMYRFKDAVKLKGEENARIHCGIIAQEIVSIFESEGLDATDYALLCYDEWEDVYKDIIEINEETGEPIMDEETGEPNIIGQELELAAGNRYGVRYEELLAFIISAM